MGTGVYVKETWAYEKKSGVCVEDCLRGVLKRFFSCLPLISEYERTGLDNAILV